MESERQKEIERERQLASGTKAREATVLNKRPFLPKQSDRGPVRPHDFTFHTDLRSEERQKFDQRIKEKEAEMEAAKQQVSLITTTMRLRGHLLFMLFRKWPHLTFHLSKLEHFKYSVW